MAIDAPYIADFQRGGVDKADAGTLPTPEPLGIYEKGKQNVAHQFHKPVIADRRGEIVPHINADLALVIPLETSVA